MTLFNNICFDIDPFILKIEESFLDSVREFLEAIKDDSKESATSNTNIKNSNKTNANTNNK